MDSAVVEIIGSMPPQPGEPVQAEDVGSPELEEGPIAEIARQVRQAAEDRDVAEITKAIERLPAGSKHRTTLMTDDFDLDRLVESAAELEQICAGRG